MAIVCEQLPRVHVVPCPGCLGSGMSSRVTDDQGGPGRCEACAGAGEWTSAELEEYEAWLESLDRSIAAQCSDDPPTPF